MSNMSYCRFQNTRGDLLDCQGALEEIRDGEIENLSKEEAGAALRLIAICSEIVNDSDEDVTKQLEEWRNA